MKFYIGRTFKGQRIGFDAAKTNAYDVLVRMANTTDLAVRTATGFDLTHPLCMYATSGKCVAHVTHKGLFIVPHGLNLPAATVSQVRAVVNEFNQSLEGAPVPKATPAVQYQARWNPITQDKAPDYPLAFTIVQNSLSDSPKAALERFISLEGPFSISDFNNGELVVLRVDSMRGVKLYATGACGLFPYNMIETLDDVGYAATQLEEVEVLRELNEVILSSFANSAFWDKVTYATRAIVENGGSIKISDAGNMGLVIRCRSQTGGKYKLTVSPRAPTFILKEEGTEYSLDSKDFLLTLIQGATCLTDKE